MAYSPQSDMCGPTPQASSKTLSTWIAPRPVRGCTGPSPRYATRQGAQPGPRQSWQLPELPVVKQRLAAPQMHCRQWFRCAGPRDTAHPGQTCNSCCSSELYGAEALPSVQLSTSSASLVISTTLGSSAGCWLLLPPPMQRSACPWSSCGTDPVRCSIVRSATLAHSGWTPRRQRQAHGPRSIHARP